MVVGKGGELYKDFSHNPHLWFSDTGSWQIVKIPYDSPDVAAKFHHGGAAFGQGGNAAGLPFPMECIGTAGFCLIWPGGIEHAHENIAVYNGLHGLCNKGDRKCKTGVGLHAVSIDRHNGHLGHSCFFQGAPDEPYVVGCTAASACLCHQNSCVVQVIPAGKQGVHDLSDDNQGRVACIIVHVLESHVHRVAVVVLQYFNPVSEGTDGRL